MLPIAQLNMLRARATTLEQDATDLGVMVEEIQLLKPSPRRRTCVLSNYTLVPLAIVAIMLAILALQVSYLDSYRNGEPWNLVRSVPTWR